MKHIFKYFKKEIPLAILGVVFVIMGALIDLYQIQLMAGIIDNGIATGNFSVVVSIGLKMIGLALLGLVVGMLGLIFPSQVSNRFAQNLRRDIFAKIQTFTHNNMNQFQTSSLVTRLTNDVNMLQRAMMMALRMMFRSPVFLLSTIVMTYMMNTKLSWIMIITVTVLAMFLIFIIKAGFSRFVTLQEDVDDMNRVVQEGLTNIRVIKSFVRYDYEEDKFDEDNEKLYQSSVKAQNLMVMMNPILMLSINVATIIIVYFSGDLIVNKGMLTVGDLLVFVNYLRFTMFSMFTITHILVMFSRSKASVVRIDEILSTEADFTANGASLMPTEGRIRFNDVNYRYYENAENVLKDVNFELNPGERLGIIGSTGSGKSTLVNLIGRLSDVTEGTITMDGVNIQEYDLKVLRSQLGFVPQKNVLFTGTILENLRLGNPNASMDMIIEATKAASIYEFIMELPKQFDAPVQQGGTNFSGGQRQRLCIARALIVNPKVLILDDSTSALDATTEANVMASLTEHFPKLSLISIAQKISSVSLMDKILVIDHGEIIGSGTHDLLLESNEIYQEIYESQMERGGLE